VTHAHPDSAPLGTAFMAATVVVMFTLAWGKRRVGNALDSRPLAADATMTLIDGFLASGVLLALLLDRIAGLWWADPLAAAVVALVAFNEGREGWTSACVSRRRTAGRRRRRHPGRRARRGRRA